MSFLSSQPEKLQTVPASLSYFTIFSPLLRPQDGASEDQAADAAQILFYTSRERAVSQDRMLRQIGVAIGIVNFAGMVGNDPSLSVTGSSSSFGKGKQKAAAQRCWNVHSSRRRMVLVEVQSGLWVHAVSDLSH